MLHHERMTLPPALFWDHVKFRMILAGENQHPCEFTIAPWGTPFGNHSDLECITLITSEVCCVFCFNAQSQKLKWNAKLLFPGCGATHTFTTGSCENTVGVKANFIITNQYLYTTIQQEVHKAICRQ